MDLASIMRHRIQLQRFVEGAGNIGHAFVPLYTVWAAFEDQGEGRYRISMRWRDDLNKQGDIEPAMRVIRLSDGETLIVDSCSTSIPKVETQLLTHREIIGPIDHLATGTRRIKSWP